MRLRGELIHIDAVLRLFDPDTDPPFSALSGLAAQNGVVCVRRDCPAHRRGAAPRRSVFSHPACGSCHQGAGAGWCRLETRRDIVSKFSSILYTMTRRGRLVKVGRGLCGGDPVFRVMLSPVEQCAQHWAQVVALFRQHIFGARRVLFVKTTFDNSSFEALQSGTMCSG
jgi:hypothetical protein